MRSEVPRTRAISSLLQPSSTLLTTARSACDNSLPSPQVMALALSTVHTPHALRKLVPRRVGPETRCSVARSEIAKSSGTDCVRQRNPIAVRQLAACEATVDGASPSSSATVF
ncbi:MAG TPA: hypothetical protein VHM70_28535 [Polyangiaceae bacterium]|nr:hypothetical protein [Polyangiaceae bacterium]